MILLREGSGGSAFDPLGGERERVRERSRLGQLIRLEP
jgi:hypothetical protein